LEKPLESLENQGKLGKPDIDCATEKETLEVFNASPKISHFPQFPPSPELLHPLNFPTKSNPQPQSPSNPTYHFSTTFPPPRIIRDHPLALPNPLCFSDECDELEAPQVFLCKANKSCRHSLRLPVFC
jgi:hypothetical protein